MKMGNIQIETIRTGEFSMDYFRFGNGKNILVILPGLSVDSVMKYADGVAEAYSVLTEDFTVYLFDRRRELPENYSISDMAEDTILAIRKLGLQDICLFGASQGGMIAMTIAIEEPDLVRKLVLGSTAARVDRKKTGVVENWIRLAGEGRIEELYLAFGEAIYPPEVFSSAKEMLIAGAKGITEEDLFRFGILADAVKGFDVTEKLSSIQCPVLILGSKDDRVLGPETSEEIYEYLKERKDCELYMYDGYGHAAYDMASDYKERLLRFFTA